MVAVARTTGPAFVACWLALKGRRAARWLTESSKRHKAIHEYLMNGQCNDGKEDFVRNACAGDVVLESSDTHAEAEKLFGLEVHDLCNVIRVIDGDMPRYV